MVSTSACSAFSLVVHTHASCHQSVSFGTGGHKAVMKGGGKLAVGMCRTSHVSSRVVYLSMGSQGLTKGGEHSAYTVLFIWIVYH